MTQTSTFQVLDSLPYHIMAWYLSYGNSSHGVHMQHVISWHDMTMISAWYVNYVPWYIILIICAMIYHGIAMIYYLAMILLSLHKYHHIRMCHDISWYAWYNFPIQNCMVICCIMAYHGISWHIMIDLLFECPL